MTNFVSLRNFEKKNTVNTFALKFNTIWKLFLVQILKN